VCHDDAARPPAPEKAGTARSEEEIVLAAADGNRFAAYVARAQEPSGAGIVVMPDVRGLYQFYKDLAVRFAEIGVDAVAIDYYGRSAGISSRSAEFDWMTHVQQTTPQGVAADVAAAADYLRSNDVDVTSVFTVGFCVGGGYSWRQSADTPGLAGCIGFYGRPQSAAAVVDRMRAPLLMLVAGKDEGIPVSDVESLAAAARAAGTHVDFVVYEDAPHSFFDRTFDEHADACADAWRRIRSFITKTQPVRR